MTEEELNEKTHIEALFSEWEFQNAEGIYTFDRDVMFKHCFEDAYKLGKKELVAQIEKMKCCGNCRFSESDKLNGTFCHREGCFVVASTKCKLWEN